MKVLGLMRLVRLVRVVEGWLELVRVGKVDENKMV
jgi:hypothetical protein